MCNEKDIDNKPLKPKKPKTADSKAARFIERLLKRETVNRTTLDELGISEKNDSAHTIVSTLRNEWLVPVISEQTKKGGVSNYYMTSWEIERYKDPILRIQQRKEMKSHVDEKRTHNALKSFFKSLVSWRKAPELRQHVDSSPVKIKEISREINALID